MVDCGVRIHDAMIATFGERVEDTFLVSGADGELLDEEQRGRLVDAIRRHLELD